MAVGSSSQDRSNHIESRDFDTHRNARSGETRRLLDDNVDIWNETAEGIRQRDRKRMQREVRRVVSFICAVLSCLCAGSITAYSLYGGRFLTDLGYTQYQVNGVSIAAELAMYLPVPLFGYLCDRYSPKLLSFLASVLFGFGYIIAAQTYDSILPDDEGRTDEWPWGVMVFAFILIGMGTSCMYLSAVATCAKNFGKGKYRGFLLAVPIAAFGLSGMWQSQVGAQLLYKPGPNGEKGDVDVFHYFLFLAATLFAVGLVGTAGLRVVDEEEMIEEAVEELERSGLLEQSDFFRFSGREYNSNIADVTRRRGYGTLARDRDDDDNASDTYTVSTTSTDPLTSTLLGASKSERRLKYWLLNHETRRFLSDRTMWYLAAGFFLVTGPGEAYINNLGTIIPTLTPKEWASRGPPAGSPSTNISIIAVTSTIARLATGALSDIFTPRAEFAENLNPSPDPPPETTQTEPLASSPSPPHQVPHSKRFALRRPVLLLVTDLILVVSFLTLSFPQLLPSNPSLFQLSSSLLGLGYGAIFSLVPIVITVVWGVENFATNWGIVAMMPAGGAALWGVLYSVGYSVGTKRDEMVCHGWVCFGPWAIGCVASTIVAGGLFWSVGREWRRKGIIV